MATRKVFDIESANLPMQDLSTCFGSFDSRVYHYDAKKARAITEHGQRALQTLVDKLGFSLGDTDGPSIKRELAK